jgi:hypothetical protein
VASNRPERSSIPIIPKPPNESIAMIRHGTAPFLECSSHGDPRFSAFHARIRGRGGRTIESIYQAAKVFADGTTGLDWRAAKGRKAVNQADCAVLYARLWDMYIAENPQLLSVLRHASGLSDMFGQSGHCCQATELWRIRAGALPLNR